MSIMVPYYHWFAERFSRSISELWLGTIGGEVGKIIKYLFRTREELTLTADIYVRYGSSSELINLELQKSPAVGGVPACRSV